MIFVRTCDQFLQIVCLRVRVCAENFGLRCFSGSDNRRWGGCGNRIGHDAVLLWDTPVCARRKVNVMSIVYTAY